MRQVSTSNQADRKELEMLEFLTGAPGLSRICNGKRDVKGSVICTIWFQSFDAAIWDDREQGDNMAYAIRTQKIIICCIVLVLTQGCAINTNEETRSQCTPSPKQQATTDDAAFYLFLALSCKLTEPSRLQSR